MTTNAWTHLPNAPHIGRVLAHLKAHPEKWDAARGTAWAENTIAARVAARGRIWNITRDAVWSTSKSTAKSIAKRPGSSAFPDAAWDALLALIAYDDCAYILDLNQGAIRLMMSNNHPAATLMQLAAIALKEHP